MNAPLIGIGIGGTGIKTGLLTRRNPDSWAHPSTSRG